MSSPQFTVPADENKKLLHIDLWYKQFTLFGTLEFAARVTSKQVCLYAGWAFLWWFVEESLPEMSKWLHASFALKVLTFLVGILISLTLKESLDRYRSCLGALIDFRDEYRSFWYFLQLQLLQNEGARLVLDIHMVAFALSVLRSIMVKNEDGVTHHIIEQQIQEEFRDCVLFDRDGVYWSMGSNPQYSELLLLSWIRTLGLMDRDVRQRWGYARAKLHQLMTSQRVRSPRTAVHLLRIVVHVFLITVPVCGSSVSTKMATPIMTLVLISLLKLAEELEDPFGTDEHDLPWPVLLATVTRCRVACPRSFLSGAISFFNEACQTSTWDTEKVKQYFGEDACIEPESQKCAYDSGKIQLGLYITRDDLDRMDVVGNLREGDHDVLFSDLMHNDIGSQVISMASRRSPESPQAGRGSVMQWLDSLQ